MDTNCEQLHPNWRTLATINYPMKRFVRGLELQSQPECKRGRPDLTATDSEGVKIKKFYENLIKECSTNRRPTVSPTSKAPPSIKDILRRFDRNTFFRFVTTNNIAELARFAYFENDINVCDEFGWTGLMMAACEGAIDTVRLLLQLGADKNIKDKTGRTALDLAQIKGYSNVVYTLQIECQHVKTTVDARTITLNEPFYCDICNHVFSDTNRLHHLTSTVHQFNTESKTTKNKLNKFNITTRNRGLQIMVKQGWDRESGLGPTSSGRLYPIKTVMRKKLSGLGTDQEPARVTHFGAFDQRAVENNKLNNSPSYKKIRSRKDMHREKVREWKREKRLRKELS
ncbi:G patch domain and ankyrin repeat-containing protein 1 homolog [Eurosta solidaginis]|uniref:G patch domain and ankyrin repeat-containing protein 1 homolog n=1 Tax=Eurosta solidaginis TaxID=178769 RepID=UPI003530953B